MLTSQCRRLGWGPYLKCDPGGGLGKNARVASEAARHLKVASDRQQKFGARSRALGQQRQIAAMAQGDLASET